MPTVFFRGKVLVKQRHLLQLVYMSVLIFSSSVLAEESYKAPLVKDSLMLGISKHQSMLAVGERGHVLISSLDETDFEQVIVPTKVTLTAVEQFGSEAWAVGHDASIIKSEDGGNSWRLLQQAPELDRPLLDVLFFDANEGIAVGAYGLFYRTLDGGETWTQERHASVLSADDNDYLESIKDDEAFYLEELSFISPHFNRLSISDNILYVAGEAGLIARSLDRGRNWVRLDIDYFGSFFDVRALPTGDVLAIGLRGNMFLLSNPQASAQNQVDFTNNGSNLSFKRINTCLTNTLNGIVVDDEAVFIVGNNGVVLEIDAERLSSDSLKPANKENCRQHASINELQTDFSDAIANAVLHNSTLLLASAGGLKMIEVNK